MQRDPFGIAADDLTGVEAALDGVDEGPVGRVRGLLRRRVRHEARHRPTEHEVVEVRVGQRGLAIGHALRRQCRQRVVVSLGRRLQRGPEPGIALAVHRREEPLLVAEERVDGHRRRPGARRQPAQRQRGRALGGQDPPGFVDEPDREVRRMGLDRCHDSYYNSVIDLITVLWQ
jgi:hypothetical protein